MATKKKKKQRVDSRKPRTKKPELSMPLPMVENLATLQNYQNYQLKLLSEETARLEKEIQGLKFGAIIKEQTLLKELKEAQCPHRKPNNMSAYNGQFDHQGTLHLVCAYCQHNLHLDKDYVHAVRLRHRKPEGPAGEKIEGSYYSFGGPEGSPAHMGDGIGCSYEELQKRAIEERTAAIELCGFDPEDLPVAALEALLHSIDSAKRFMDGEKK